MLRYEKCWACPYRTPFNHCQLTACAYQITASINTAIDIRKSESEYRTRTSEGRYEITFNTDDYKWYRFVENACRLAIDESKREKG